MQSSSLPKPTTRQIRRWQRMQELGCVASILDGVLGVPGEIHHLLSGGRRISHNHTVCLSPWHHRGIVPEGRTAADYEHIHGPSLALKPNAFRRRYGDEEELLAIQDALLDHYLEQIGTTK